MYTFKRLRTRSSSFQRSQQALERAFQEMQALRDHHRLVIDNIAGLVWSALHDGQADFFNQRWLEYTGLSLEEALGQGWRAAIHAEDLPRLLDVWQVAFAAGKSAEIEARMRRFDGEYRWFLFRAVPLRDDAGRIIKWYGTNTEIEDRKRAEDALRTSEQSFRLIVESMPGFTCTMTAAGEIEFGNQRILEYTGWTLEELKDWTSLVHEDDLALVLTLWRRSIETGDSYEVEHRIRGANGIYRWFLVRGLPRRDTEGRILRWYIVLSDIDERKQAEEKLRRSETNLLEAQRLGRMGSWTHDVASGTVTTSPEALRIFGVIPNEDPSTAEFFFNRIHPEDRPSEVRNYERARLAKANFASDYRIVLPDGSIKYIHNIGHPIVNESGELLTFVGTTMDVTEQHRSRVELEKAFEEIKRLKDRLQHENVALREEIDTAFMFEEIVGTSPALQSVLARVAKVAPTDSTVLITGETGTGKELIARAIHKRSPRAARAFVSVNCAAIPSSLIASELFGHEKGAFTGALQRRLGRFELADGGTLFLDEVGDLPAEMQIALLRVLQEREFERVGGSRAIAVDVRVVAATNRDLDVAISAGMFRSDLFYRLSVFPVEMPSLRARKEDIPLLVEYFIHRYARKAGKKIRGINAKTLELLQAYPWPGNIRELQNVIERSVIVCETEIFSVDASWLAGASVPPPRVIQPLPDQLAVQERAMIEAALAECGGRVSGPSGAAAKLGMPRSTLDSKIRSLKINKHRFKTD